MWYFYDESGNVLGYEYSYLNASGAKVKKTIYYEKNLQGDVIGLLDDAGNEIATYSYDAWGNVTSYTYTSGNYLSYSLNHIKYRGYYRDDETGFYYLQSRYYDSETCRFLNADDAEYLGMGSTVLRYNIYSYCEGNPIKHTDNEGEFALLDDMVILGIAIIILFTFAYIYTLNVNRRYWSASNLKKWTSTRTSLSIRWIPNVVFGALITLAKASKLSKKARATDAPSWAKGKAPKKGESAEDYARRLLDEKYGKGNWKTGPGSEHNRLKKYGTRNLGLN